MKIPEIGAIYDDKYKIIGPLGRGGFASAYLADDLKLNEKVVLKFPEITQLGDPAVYERFRREIAIGKILKHDDLPLVTSYSEGNPPYLVIKYVEGYELHNLIKEKGRFSAEEVIRLISNLLDVVQYCHEKGVCHRDIKPENLMLSDNGHLKIIDFGIAGMEGAPRVTYRGFSSLVGTPEYMSPEQIKGERCGPKTDIYAVGCVMYTMLAGNPPYTGDNPLAVMYQHMTAEPKPLCSICDDVTKNLWAVIRKALMKRKEDRYDSCEKMAYDLRHLDEVDLSILNKKDEPLSTVTTSKKTRLYVLIGVIAVGITVILMIILLNK